MKVLFITNALTHYYNLVLSKLANEADVDLVVVAPSRSSSFVGDGVYETKDGITFKVIELDEALKFRFYTSLTGLADVIRKERPDVVIVNQYYLKAFLLDLNIVIAMKSSGASLILKSIPFRMPLFQETLNAAKNSTIEFRSLPPNLRSLLKGMHADRLVARLLAYIDNWAINLPDAHVNYVEAYELWESYGVEKRKVFITRNSPDTDFLLSVKENLSEASPILPRNPYRLIHVGRLVEWKRVDMLIRAFAKVRKFYPRAELLVVGSGPEVSALKRLGNELELGESLIFTGGVYEASLLGQYYTASSVYVLAGMGGLSINEAMCFGLPVICSVCDGTEKVLVRDGKNGKYFRDGDEDDLVDKIKWFFERPNELREMGKNSECIIRNEVNIRTVIDGYMKALRFVCQKRSI